MPYDPYGADEHRDSRYMDDDEYRRMRKAEDDEYELPPMMRWKKRLSFM